METHKNYFKVCPQCGSQNVKAFDDGSGKCQDCGNYIDHLVYGENKWERQWSGILSGGILILVGILLMGSEFWLWNQVDHRPDEGLGIAGLGFILFVAGLYLAVWGGTTGDV